MIILIHYSEIALKKGNRSIFEKKLIENIRTKLKSTCNAFQGNADREANALKIKNLRGRILLTLPRQGIKKAGIKEKLSQIFGIAWFAFIEKAESDIRKIKTLVKKAACKISSQESFAVRVTRADKNFSLCSIEVEKILGELIQKNTGAKVDLSNPDKTLFVEINEKHTFIFWQKIKGLGGLPVGASGKVICLFSGGIDSAVAAYLMAKRGASVSLVHFSAVSVKEVKKSKITKIYRRLENFTGKTKLFIIPYETFQMVILGLSGRASRYEVLLFRRFMRRVAEALAEKEKALGLVTGDNLGQVASQTLENLLIFDQRSSLPILRPLLGYDKQEIVDLAKKIGTYNLSILPYKDCCSIIQKKPITRGKWGMIERLEKEINIDKIVEESSKEMIEI